MFETIRPRIIIRFLHGLALAAMFCATVGGGHLMKAEVPAFSPDSTVRISGVRILVSDIDEAVAFYSATLGFKVLSTVKYPAEVELKSEGLQLFLARTRMPAQYDYAGSVRSTFGFQANNLLETRANLEGKGVVFLEPEPQKVGVGIATTFKDPSGNVLYLLEQQVGDKAPFEEPRIYNVGFHLPDEAVARQLYCDVLGFVVRTERYFPAIPLGHPDGTFAFMLHEKDDLKPRTSKYPDEAQIVPLFEATDLDAVLERLRRSGMQYAPVASTNLRAIAAYDAFGNVIEISEPGIHMSE